MSRRIYSKFERDVLSLNPNVKAVTENSITYTAEFKIVAVQKFVDCHISAKHIFEEAGFDLSILGVNKPKDCLKRWKSIYLQTGIDGLLTETRGVGSTGRPKKSPMTPEEELMSMKRKLKRLEKENALLKKLEPLERRVIQSKSKKYSLIQEFQSETLGQVEHLNVSELCEIVGVSRSGYYKWLKNESRRQRRAKGEFEDYQAIKSIFDKERGKAGWRTVRMNLETLGIVMNHKKIIRIMKKFGLRASIRQADPYRQIRKARMEHRTFPNLINREFNRFAPYQAFGTDITYLKSKFGFTGYLSVLLDYSTSEVLHFKLEQSLSLDLSVGLMNEALSLPELKPEEIMIHSDQGIHYTCAAYTTCLAAQGVTQSMSRKGNCLDNAPVESFFGHMKDELDYESAETFGDLSKRVSEHIFKYNHLRKQWTKKKMAPVDFRNHLLAA